MYAGLLVAIRTQNKNAKLADQRIVVAGAGSAGLGVASAIYKAMERESGLTKVGGPGNTS